ncbi:MAG: RsmB/NOP family class I SAM-dependent RNA methyltransferase [Clostridia bacterium]|jgi:NOL1/NOP2/sun family putative RNA methylase
MKFLEEKLEKQYGTKITKEIIEGFQTKRKTTLRINTIKNNIEEIKKELEKEKIEYETIKWSKEALIIKNADEKTIQEMEIYKNGKIYLQSLSSMLPPIILEPKEGTDILDMAAAPGGKTTQIAALTNNKAHITACEKNKIRAERLKYNVDKQGATCVFIMPKDSRFIDDFFSFDQILLDAPCSGSGTLDYNDANVEKYFTEQLIERSSKTQKTLLSKAIKLLKPGHEMVYSTCSILDCENEDVVSSVIKHGNIEIVPINFEGMEKLPILPTKISGTLCVKPTELYEGFFVAKIKRL